MEFIDVTIKYASRLDQAGLPVIFSLEHFAQHVGLPSTIVKNSIQYRANQYSRFKVSKKNQKNEFRFIMSPEPKLNYIQVWINKNILQRVAVPETCMAYIPGKSAFLNAYVHRNSNSILKVDLLKFFDTITEERVFGVFKSLGYHANLAVDFAKLTTTYHSKSFWSRISGVEKDKLRSIIEKKPPILPQGSPTSPQLANIIAMSMDRKLITLCNSLDCRYSRYADDLIFSTTKNKGSLPNLENLKKIIEGEEGFFINDQKTKMFKNGQKQYVTGFTVTHGVHVPKKFRQEVIKHLYYSKKYGPYEHLKRWTSDNSYNETIIYGFQNWLLGKIAFIMSAHYAIGKKMLEEFNKIDWMSETSNNGGKIENEIEYEKSFKA